MPKGWNEIAMDNKTVQNIDEYIASFPESVQEILKKIRQTIKETAPEAGEKISYGIPTFTLAGRNLVHFAAYKSHIGFYPSSSGIEKYKREISGYKTSKGTVQFPLDQPIPYDLIRKMVIFRVDENLAYAASKGKKKSWYQEWSAMHKITPYLGFDHQAQAAAEFYISIFKNSKMGYTH